MKILIDIGHPAHVHYFRNFIHLMEERGHYFKIITRDKEVTQKLLDRYQLPYRSRGKGKKSLLGKLFYTLKADWIVLIEALSWKPDVFMSFGSPYVAHVSSLLRKPHIALTDTEHATLGIKAFEPFTETIITPYCYNNDFGSKQVRFDGYFELCYLHPKYFKPDPLVLEKLGLKRNEKYVILRFVSWIASHDLGQTGLNLETKYNIVSELSKFRKVFISSEGELPDELKDYQINIMPDMMHDVLAYSDLFIGEGATMASECACLGTPAIYVNSLEVGYCKEQENKYGLVYGFRDSDGVLPKAMELLEIDDLEEVFGDRRSKMLDDKIDVTEFLVSFVERYNDGIDSGKQK